MLLFDFSLELLKLGCILFIIFYLSFIIYYFEVSMSIAQFNLTIPCGVNHDGGAVDFDGVRVEGDARSELTLGLATGTKSESQ